MQEIIISFSEEDVLDEVKGAKDGYAFTYKDYLYVSIMAEDGYIPSIFGFCEINKTIRTLYESLLWKAFLYPTEIKEYSQCNPMMTVYNKIKSPIIESFLTGKKDAKDCYSMRQVHIKSVLVINPDYDELICDETHLVIDDEELSRIVGGKFDVKGFYEWGREIHPIVIAAEFGEPYNMEWGDYHRRGLEFAKELRKCLPSEYDLWYHKPFEDNTCSIPERQLIM